MKKIIFSLIIISTMLFSCVDETYYQESNECNIVVFDILGQVSNKIIEGKVVDTGLVEVGVPNNFNLNDLNVHSFRLSALAKSDKDVFKIKDFSKDVYLKITAEDNQTFKIWKIRVIHSEALFQLPFSSMKEWTIAKDDKGNEIKIGSTYAYFPGRENIFSPWQHSAKANTMVGFFSVNPKPDVQNADYASLQTKLYPTGAMMHSAIVAGGLYTGRFIFNSIHLPGIGSDPNPRKMVDLGTPFQNKPQSVRLKIRYKPGLIMKDGDNKEILPNDALNRPSKDSCEIYFMLQNRSLDPTKYNRVATAWLRTSETIGDFNSEDGFVEINLPFIYGQPDAQTLLEKPYMKIGGVRGELIYYKFIPNGTTYDKIEMPEVYAPIGSEVDNIIVVFSSSAYGDMFWGAPDSRLDVKDIEFIY
jgi:hypothetical protein